LAFTRRAPCSAGHSALRRAIAVPPSPGRMVYHRLQPPARVVTAARGGRADGGAAPARGRSLPDARRGGLRRRRARPPCEEVRRRHPRRGQQGHEAPRARQRPEFGDAPGGLLGPRRQDDVARRSAAPGLPIGAGFRPHPMRHSICDSDGDSRWCPSRRVAPVVGCPDHRFRLGGRHRLWQTVLCTRWRVVRRGKRSRWSGVRARVAKSPRDLHAPERQPAERSGLASLPGQVETSNRTGARSLPIGVGHLAAQTPSVASCAASIVWMRPTVVMGHQRL
jgi:hypothetical protein